MRKLIASVILFWLMLFSCIAVFAQAQTDDLNSLADFIPDSAGGIIAMILIALEFLFLAVPTSKNYSMLVKAGNILKWIGTTLNNRKKPEVK